MDHSRGYSQWWISSLLKSLSSHSALSCLTLTNTVHLHKNNACFILIWALPTFWLCYCLFLQMDQLSCNGDRKLQPDRSQAIRERLRGKGLPTGKCFIAALGKTRFGEILQTKKSNRGGLAYIHRTLVVQYLAKSWWWFQENIWFWVQSLW